MFVGVTSNAKELLSAAVERLTAALRPQTRIQYLRQFKVFMAFTIYTGTQSLNSRSTIITFLEFLARNALSYRVIMNYVSALKFHFCHYQIPTGVFEDYFVKRLLRGIQYSVPLVVRPRGLFSLSQIREIVRICDIFENSLTYRGAFLLAFYGLLRISKLPLPHQSSLIRLNTFCAVTLGLHTRGYRLPLNGPRTCRPQRERMWLNCRGLRIPSCAQSQRCKLYLRDFDHNLWIPCLHWMTIRFSRNVISGNACLLACASWVFP